MSYHGKQDGIPIYDYLDEVPDSIVESGQNFYVMYPPDEIINNGSAIFEKTNSFTLTIWSFIGICVIVSLVGTAVILALQQLGYLLQGRPGQKVDENMFEGGDGSIWVRDPVTGEWIMEKGPRIDMIIWAIVAIALIAVAVLVYLSYKKKGGKKNPNNPCKKEGGKSSKGSKPKSS